jgi:hypothetical protein
MDVCYYFTDSMPQSCIDRMRMHIVMKREKILRAMMDNGNCDDSGMPGYRGQHKYQPNEKQIYTGVLYISPDVAVHGAAFHVMTSSKVSGSHSGKSHIKFDAAELILTLRSFCR